MIYRVLYIPDGASTVSFRLMDDTMFIGRPPMGTHNSFVCEGHKLIVFGLKTSMFHGFLGSNGSWSWNPKQPFINCCFNWIISRKMLFHPTFLLNRVFRVRGWTKCFPSLFCCRWQVMGNGLTFPLFLQVVSCVVKGSVWGDKTVWMWHGGGCKVGTGYLGNYLFVNLVITKNVRLYQF